MSRIPNVSVPWCWRAPPAVTTSGGASCSPNGRTTCRCTACARLVSSEGLNWLIGQRLQRRFGSLINILGPLVLQTKPQAFVAQVHAILDMSDSMRDELHLITAPTLVITGTQDSLTPVGDAEELHELIATSQLVLLSGAADLLMAETPIAFNDAISAFIDEVDAAAGGPAPHRINLRVPRRLFAAFRRYSAGSLHTVSARRQRCVCRDSGRSPGIAANTRHGILDGGWVCTVSVVD